MSLSNVDARPRAALSAPRQALYPTFSAAWAATSGFVLAGGPSSRCRLLRGATNTLFRKDPRDKSLLDRAGSSLCDRWFFAKYGA